MGEKDNSKLKYLTTAMVIFFIFLIVFFLFLNLRINGLKQKINEGYDYCVEWSGYIDRDNLIYNCYDLVNLEFQCDYKIKGNELRFLPILNITKNEEGEIIEIVYDEPIYHNCTRWLKSRGVNG